MTPYEVLEQAMVRAARNQPALMAARAEWARLAGEVHDDEPLYEERAAAFLEWFLVDYRAWRSSPETMGETMPQTMIASMITEASDERPALMAIAASHRSLFQVRELFADGVLLDDLWGGAVFRVHERRRLAGLSSGELFDARLIANIHSPPELLFGHTFCFHPREAEEGMRHQIAQVRQAGESRETLLFRLLRLRVRCERYRHVSPARVYTDDGALA